MHNESPREDEHSRSEANLNNFSHRQQPGLLDE